MIFALLWEGRGGLFGGLPSDGIAGEGTGGCAAKGPSDGIAVKRTGDSIGFAVTAGGGTEGKGVLVVMRAEGEVEACG